MPDSRLPKTNTTTRYNSEMGLSFSLFKPLRYFRTRADQIGNDPKHRTSPMQASKL